MLAPPLWLDAVFWPLTSWPRRVATSVAFACLRKMTSLRVLGEASASSLEMSWSKKACSRASAMRRIWLVRSSGW